MEHFKLPLTVKDWERLNQQQQQMFVSFHLGLDPNRHKAVHLDKEDILKKLIELKVIKKNVMNCNFKLPKWRGKR